MQKSLSVVPLASALFAAISESEHEQELLLLRDIVLASKPLLDAVHQDFATDLLCLVNYKLNKQVPEQEIAFYGEQVARDLDKLASADQAP